MKSLTAVALIAALALSGCAVQQSQNSFSNSIQRMYAYDRDAVVSRMGAPDSIAELSDGEILTYRDEQRDSLSGYYDYTFKCQVDFRITDGRVTNIQLRGSSSHPYYDDAENCNQVYQNR